MHKLPSHERARILHLLCEGNSIRAVTRLTGASKITVSKLLVDAGAACMAYHNANVRNVKAFFSLRRSKFEPYVPLTGVNPS